MSSFVKRILTLVLLLQSNTLLESKPWNPNYNYSQPQDIIFYSILFMLYSVQHWRSTATCAVHGWYTTLPPSTVMIFKYRMYVKQTNWYSKLSLYVNPPLHLNHINIREKYVWHSLCQKCSSPKNVWLHLKKHWVKRVENSVVHGGLKKWLHVIKSLKQTS